MNRFLGSPSALLRRAVLLGAALGGAALSCGREPTAPGAERWARGLSFQAQFPTMLQQAGSSASSVVPFDRVRLLLRHVEGAAALDTMVTFPPGSDQTTVSLSVRLASSAPPAGEPMVLTLDYVNTAGVTVFRGGPVTVTVTPAAAGPPSPVQVAVTYTGPGASAARVVIAPRSVTAVEGDGFTFTAQATDVGGAPIPNTPIVWTALDPARATITAPTAGAGVAQGQRGTARVVAQLLTGLVDTVTVQVLLRARTLAAQTGSAQRATVGTPLASPLIALVTASDGVGVAGVPVTFAVTAGGGSVASATVATDASGLAQTAWTLGSVVGAQTVTASAAGLSGSPLTFGATGLAEVTAKLVVTTQPVSTTAGATLATVTITAQDASNRTTPTFTGPVSIAFGASAAAATLGGLTTVTAVAGVASFATLTVNRIGTGYTLVASSPGLPSATSTAFDIAAGPGRRLAFGGYPVAGATAGVTIDPITVTARDTAGNLATTFTGTVTLAFGTSPTGGALLGRATATAVNGMATFDSVRLTVAGDYQFSASANGLTGAIGPAFPLGAGPAATFALVSGAGQAAPGGTTLAQPILVQVADAFGNPVAGAGRPVTFAVTAGGGGIAPASTTTNASGRASTTWTLGGVAGAQSITASSAGLGALTVGATANTTALTFASVVAGYVHTCGRTAVGAAYCWGYNQSGELGDGTATDRLIPTPVAGGVPFASLTVGNQFTCGLAAGGAAYCWGYNGDGELGDGSTTDRPTPTPVVGGLIFASLAAGHPHACGRTSAGAAYCWGYNGDGELGDGTTTNRSAPTSVAGGIVFASLTTGHSHTCGLTAAGVAYCWGDNVYGTLGDGTTTNRNSPTAVAGGLLFASLTAGNYFTCGLTATGAAYCWGYNPYAELGDGTTTSRSAPTPVAGGLLFASLTAGYVHACGRTSGGVAYCWGWNQYGQLGDGTISNTRLTPTPIAGGLLFASLITGDSQSTCGMTAGGATYCWGWNQYGQLGDGTTTNRSVPTLVIP